MREHRPREDALSSSPQPAHADHQEPGYTRAAQDFALKQARLQFKAGPDGAGSTAAAPTPAEKAHATSNASSETATRSSFAELIAELDAIRLTFAARHQHADTPYPGDDRLGEQLDRARSHGESLRGSLAALGYARKERDTTFEAELNTIDALCNELETAGQRLGDETKARLAPVFAPLRAIAAGVKHAFKASGKVVIKPGLPDALRDKVIPDNLKAALDALGAVRAGNRRDLDRAFAHAAEAAHELISYPNPKHAAHHKPLVVRLLAEIDALHARDPNAAAAMKSHPHPNTIAQLRRFEQ
jgi:hypothetical protein